MFCYIIAEEISSVYRTKDDLPSENEGEPSSGGADDTVIPTFSLSVTFCADMIPCAKVWWNTNFR